MKLKPSVFIVGLGQYFLKIRPGLEKFFHISGLADIRSSDQLHLNASDRAIYQRIGCADDIRLTSSHDCIIVLTPPAAHAALIKWTAQFGLPVMVEKPVVATIADLQCLEGAVQSDLPLYCSDSYPDVRGLPLRVWMGADIDPRWDNFFEVVDGPRHLWTDKGTALGPVLSLRGCLLEGSGKARVFGTRKWLWDPNEGGVVRDLMYHYFTLASYILDADLHTKVAQLKTRIHGRNAAWDPAGSRAEVHAFAAGIASNGVAFEFEVGKYYEKLINDRRFSIHFAGGQATARLGQQNILDVSTDRMRCRVVLKGNYYEHVARGFRMYVDAMPRRPYGLLHAIRATRAIEELRMAACRSIDTALTAKSLVRGPTQ